MSKAKALSCRLDNQETKLEIEPITNLPKIIEPSRHEPREQPQRRQQPRKREKVVPVPTYTPNGNIEEDQPPKIDVLV
jgi:hypothetical protein